MLKKQFLKKLFTIFICIVMMLMTLFVSGCSGPDNSDEADKPIEHTYQEIEFGYYAYEVPNNFTVHNIEADGYIAEENNASCDEYVIRSFCMGNTYSPEPKPGMTEADLEALKEAGYDGYTMDYRTVGKDNVEAETSDWETVDSEGKVMFVRDYIMLYGGILHILQVYSYNDDLDEIETDIVSSLHLKYETTEEYEASRESVYIDEIMAEEHEKDKAGAIKEINELVDGPNPKDGWR